VAQNDISDSIVNNHFYAILLRIPSIKIQCRPDYL